jgi:hypothetical protein
MERDKEGYLKLQGMPYENFSEAVRAEVKRRQQMGADRAAICAASIEIEETVLTKYRAARPE